MSVEYFKTNIFCQVRALKADSNGLFLIIFLYKSQCQQMGYEAGLLTRNFRRSAWIFCIGKVWTYLLKEICYKILSMHPGGNDKDLKMIRCRFRKIFNLEHNLSSLFLCLFYRISLTWINPN